MAMTRGEVPNVKLSLSVLQVVATIAGACVCAGCGYTVTATDGAVFTQKKAGPDVIASALAASASRDLPCESHDLEVERMAQEREYAVTGCGSTVVYRVDTPSLEHGRVELVSRSATHPSQVSRSSSRPGEAHPAS